MRALLFLPFFPLSSSSYPYGSAGNGSILVNYGRLDCGVGQWGPGFSNDTDLFFWSWQSDYDFRTASTPKIIDAMSTMSGVSGAEREPNYFPMKLYQTAGTTSAGTLEYELPVDAKLDYILWLHFAEIALNASLRIPDRMGWNGDPCAPISWDAWEGATCHSNANKTALVIYQLNLSSNLLGGSLPAGLGQQSLVRLDLSNNQLTGAIPDSLSSSNLKIVL